MDGRGKNQINQILGDIVGGVISRAFSHYQQSNSIVNFALTDMPAAPQKLGRPAAQHAKFQDRVVAFAKSLPALAEKLDNPIYLSFMRNMSLRASRESVFESKSTVWNIEALVNYVDALFDILVEAKLSKYLIEKHFHKFSFVQIATILDDATKIFGDGPDTQPLIRTAALQVFTKQYDSVKHAHTAYVGYLADAKQVFGDGPDTQPLIRTAAVQVFMQKYPSVKDARTAYLEIRRVRLKEKEYAANAK